MGCHWAVSSVNFSTGDEHQDANRILCVSRGKYSSWSKDYRLIMSDNFFQDEFEPDLEAGKNIKGVVNMAAVTKYLIVATSAEGTDEMALYVSDDSNKWHRAIFPHDHKLTEKAYTILESTNYSIQIDVMTGGRLSQPTGVFLSSNSNGTYFTRNIEHTNRDRWGLVDFEKVSSIQGIVLVNTVENYEELEKKGERKKIKTKISFDDGRTFQGPTCDDEELHLHSVTDLSNSGRVFSSPAPGIVMGIGNTGKYLGSYADGNLYVSDDAGLTWREGLKGPHKYEIGDQGSILVAISDVPKKTADEIKYSLNHGKDWETAPLKEKVRPVQLTTTQDSTSLKFLLEAVDGDEKRKGYLIAIDFDDMHEAQCKKEDMETWIARKGEDGEASCLMGHTQSYNRRKADADCFLKEVDFKDPQVITKDCECTDDDFECDFNFVRSEDRKECHPAEDAQIALPEGACKNPDDDSTFKGSSGWRKIPGNTCERKSGAQKDDLVDRKCTETANPDKPASGDIAKVEYQFPGGSYRQKVYLERTDVSTQTDETIIVRTDKGIFISHDHGKTWKEILKDAKIEVIYAHKYFKDVVYFITASKKVYYSVNRGESISHFEAPMPPNLEGHPVMSFHWKHKDWFIWIGDREGHSDASVTRDRGDDFHTIQRYVRRCEFVKEEKRLYTTPQERLGQDDDKLDSLIYCEARKEQKVDETNNPWVLRSSENFFEDEGTVQFSNVVDFATMSEFIVVATREGGQADMQVNASVDGRTFSSVQFPSNFQQVHQSGYTVLDSSTHSVFLHVTVDNTDAHEYGAIIKSNSNGTSYVLSLPAVDRDTVGYVDFEKTFGLEGVAMANVVANYDSKNYKKESKQLKTMITHNDGAEWNFVQPPKLDADGKKYCTGDLRKCSLNVHGYTEREDKSHTYSSSSAIGLMLATGNVGEFLDKEHDTFMTSDAGISWTSVKKGKYMWEYGDQGSIVVIVKDGKPTNVVHYTLNEGKTWEDYQFSDTELNIIDLSTLPSDNSRNFLLWAMKDGKPTSINIDFSGLTNKQCELNENDPEGGDYYLWTPKHPNQDDNCVFGHVSQYHRKRVESKCYNGKMIPGLHYVVQNCDCTRRDFEWYVSSDFNLRSITNNLTSDFNYERTSDGSCALVPGYSPPDHSLVCKVDKDRTEYFAPTGYRRIPMTTCENGKEMDHSEATACPGHEDEFDKKHSASGVGIFFAIIIPIIVAAGVGYYVWNNWASKFGQIRLGEQCTSSRPHSLSNIISNMIAATFDGEASYIKYPVLLVAGTVAVVSALPLLASSLWRSASTAFGRSRSARFTTRDSFARGRGDYAVVDEDEGELLGEESDEEV